MLDFVEEEPHGEKDGYEEKHGSVEVKSPQIIADDEVGHKQGPRCNACVDERSVDASGRAGVLVLCTLFDKDVEGVIGHEEEALVDDKSDGDTERKACKWECESSQGCNSDKEEKKFLVAYSI